MRGAAWGLPRVVVVCAVVLCTVLPVAAQPSNDFIPVTDAMLQSPEDADWLMWRRTLDGWKVMYHQGTIVAESR